VASAYFVVRGSVEVHLAQQVVARLGAGELLVFIRPPSGRIVLRPDDGSRGSLPFKSPDAHFLFAVIRAEIASDCPLGSTMPDHMIFRPGERCASPHIEAQLQCLAWEANAGQPGSALMQGCLWEVVFLHAFRMHLARISPTKGWVAAIKDPQLSKVLAAIHMDPQKNWTIDSLADRAVMSRATLARRFRSMLDMTPMDYLYQLRMRIAAALLADPALTIGAIAIRVGYASDSAFSTAFHRRYEMWPGEFRQRELAKKIHIY
jgi:AraC-like DNA-binding protein